MFNDILKWRYIFMIFHHPQNFSQQNVFQNVYSQWDPTSPIEKGKKGKRPGCIGLSLPIGKFKIYDCKEKHLVICELNFESKDKFFISSNNKMITFHLQCYACDKNHFNIPYTGCARKNATLYITL
jgi:hypothetical protein